MPHGWQIRPAQEADLPVLVAMDHAANGMTRPQLFADLLASGRAEVLVDKEGAFRPLPWNEHLAVDTPSARCWVMRKKNVRELVSHQLARTGRPVCAYGLRRRLAVQRPA